MPDRPWTGPSAGVKGDGFYYYAEASGSLPSETFALVYDGSACSASGAVGRISFFYHMYADCFFFALKLPGPRCRGTRPRPPPPDAFAACPHPA